jgi:hypothetical protein
MKPRTLEEKVSHSMDRAEIADVIGCYMDSRDWGLLRTCWTDQISLDFTDIDLVEEPITTNLTLTVSLVCDIDVRRDPP